LEKDENCAKNEFLRWRTKTAFGFNLKARQQVEKLGPNWQQIGSAAPFLKHFFKVFRPTASPR
jgi:hypothetical protein